MFFDICSKVFKICPRIVNSFRTEHLGVFWGDFWSPYVADTDIVERTHREAICFLLVYIYLSLSLYVYIYILSVLQIVKYVLGGFDLYLGRPGKNIVNKSLHYWIITRK